MAQPAGSRCWQQGSTWHARVYTRPQPKARPRVARGGGVYTPTQAAEEALAWALRPMCGAYPTGHLHVDLCMWVAGGNIGDGDNYEKLVLDAMQKAGVYTNDRQVRSCAWVVVDADDPFDERYDIVVRRLGARAHVQATSAAIAAVVARVRG